MKKETEMANGYKRGRGGGVEPRKNWTRLIIKMMEKCPSNLI